MRLSRFLRRWRRRYNIFDAILGIELILDLILEQSIAAEKRFHGARKRRHNNMAVIDLLLTDRGSQQIEG